MFVVGYSTEHSLNNVDFTAMCRTGTEVWICNKGA